MAKKSKSEDIELEQPELERPIFVVSGRAVTEFDKPTLKERETISLLKKLAGL